MSFYSNAEVRVPNKSVFNLKHRNVTSFKFDKLYPTLCDETLAGDELRLGVQSLSRFAPMVSPVFGSIKMYNHFFYVPNRLVQPFWKNFWSEDQTPTRRKLRWKTYHNNFLVSEQIIELYSATRVEGVRPRCILSIKVCMSAASSRLTTIDSAG